MRIGLYIEHGDGNGVGGAELKMAQLAAAWSRTHDVDLIHHRPPLTRERLASFADEDFRGFRILPVPREPPPPSSRNLVRRFRAAREWHRNLSESYDLFVNCTHWEPCFAHARTSVLLVLFPFFVRDADDASLSHAPAWKRSIHRAYYGIEWKRRLATYDRFLANSDYSRQWAKTRWGVDCQVVYPPVDVDIPPAPKEPLILSVGRFSTKAHGKKQLEMMQAFRASGLGTAGWTYASVGGLNSREENHAYFERVRAAGAGLPTIVESNLDRSALKDLFARARIFWHATGLNDDTEAHPELAEHFGISTVEAMAAGCVPVVINKGGQAEIVEHGISGFVWTSIEQLLNYSQMLTTDPGLWARMSAAARQRAQGFSRRRFVEQMSQECGVQDFQ
jgi:glycosyltransferase involved in cell wall biosynthesis